MAHHVFERCWRFVVARGKRAAIFVTHQPGASMLFPKAPERHRADAEEWLGRAARVALHTWDKERLLTAARLSYALADLIERRRATFAKALPAQSSGCSTDSAIAVIPASFSGDSLASRNDHT